MLFKSVKHPAHLSAHGYHWTGYLLLNTYEIPAGQEQGGKSR